MSLTHWDPQTGDRSLPLASTLWMPPPEVTDHYGDPLPPNWEFFAPPPVSIGKVLSAGSNLDLREEPMSSTTRQFIALAAAVGAGSVGLAIGLLIEAIPIWGTIIMVASLAALACWIVYVVTSFYHTCTFVGTEGLASIDCHGTRSDLLPPEILRFDQAIEMRNAFCHHYGKYGVYEHTTYEFTWHNQTNGEDILLHTIAGSHPYEFNPPPANELICFGWAAERAYTQFIYDRVQQQMKLTGFHQFNLTDGHYIRVGQDFAEFNLNGTPQQLRTADIAFASLNEGILTIQRHGATDGSNSADGIFTFGYGSIANPKLFIKIFNELVFPISQ